MQKEMAGKVDKRDEADKKKYMSVINAYNALMILRLKSEVVKRGRCLAQSLVHLYIESIIFLVH